MEMTRITMTETTGIEIPMVTVILTGVENGIIITEVKDTVIVEEGEDGIPTSNITVIVCPWCGVGLLYSW